MTDSCLINNWREGQTTDSYIIKVIATYKETEDHIITDSVLFEKVVTANRFATIKKQL